MPRLLNKNSVILGLVLAAVYVVWVNIVSPVWDRSQRPFAESVAPSVTLDDTTLDQEENISVDNFNKGGAVEIETLFWNDDVERDPFRPVQRIARSQINAIRQLRYKRANQPVQKSTRPKKAAMPPIPVMSGLVSGRTTKYVVLDTQILTEGQMINGYLVNKISHTGVQLVNPGGASVMLKVGDE